MTYEQVIQGIGKYIVRDVMPTMNTWQQILATVVVDRYMKNANNLKPILINNPLIKPLAIIDDNGNVDIDELINDIKKAMNNYGDVTFNVPVIGCRLKFNTNDMESLRSTIKEGAGSYANDTENG